MPTIRGTPEEVATLIAQAIAAGGTVTPARAPGSPQKRPKPKARELVEAAFEEPSTWTVPLYVAPGDNSRRVNPGRAGHIRSVVGRALASKLIFFCHATKWIRVGGRVKVTLTRLGPRTLDSDNLASAGKYVRDTIALIAGVDDGSPLWQWVYEQEQCPRYGVRIQIEEP